MGETTCQKVSGLRLRVKGFLVLECWSLGFGVSRVCTCGVVHAPLGVAGPGFDVFGTQVQGLGESRGESSTCWHLNCMNCVLCRYAGLLCTSTCCYTFRKSEHVIPQPKEDSISTFIKKLYILGFVPSGLILAEQGSWLMASEPLRTQKGEKQFSYT